jgi:hypothetical protein
MAASWQTWIAALLCLAAAAYIARRAWLAFAGKKAGCGSGCGSCDAAKTKRGALLTIQSDADRRS